jgi:hypothetical protein
MRFPWGSVLALVSGSVAAPLDVASEGRRPSAPSSLRCGCPRYGPGHSRGQERGGSTELFAAVSFGRSRFGAPLTDAFSASRMRTPREPSRSWRSLHRVVSTSDVPVVTRRHTRVGIRPPDVLSYHHGASRCHDVELTYESRTWLRPAGKSKTGRARERLPSSREPASSSPAGRAQENVWRSCTRAPFRLLSIRAPASVGATDFLQASALWSPRGLATTRCRRRAMRPIDFCHPFEKRAPAPRVFPARARHFRGGDAPRSLGLRTA